MRQQSCHDLPVRGDRPDHPDHPGHRGVRDRQLRLRPSAGQGLLGGHPRHRDHRDDRRNRVDLGHQAHRSAADQHLVAALGAHRHH